MYWKPATFPSSHRRPCQLCSSVSESWSTQHFFFFFLQPPNTTFLLPHSLNNYYPLQSPITCWVKFPLIISSAPLIFFLFPDRFVWPQVCFSGYCWPDAAALPGNQITASHSEVFLQMVLWNNVDGFNAACILIRFRISAAHYSNPISPCAGVGSD